MNEKTGISIAFIGDVHLGNHKVHAGTYEGGLNQRFRLIIDALKRLVCQFENGNLNRHLVLVIAGDIFDTSYPTPPMVSCLLSEVFSKFNGVIYMLAGNHDLESTHENDNSLSTISLMSERAYGVKKFNVITRNTIINLPGYMLCLVPYSKAFNAEYLSRACCGFDQIDAALYKNTKKIVCFHAGVYDHTDTNFFDKSKAIRAGDLSSIGARHGIAHFINGDWHNYKVFPTEIGQSTITQVGAFCPTGYDNQGEEYGRVITYSANYTKNSNLHNAKIERGYGAHQTRDSFICGPRFLSFGSHKDFSAFVAKNYRPKHHKHAVFVKVLTHSDAEKNAANELLSEEIEAGNIVDGTVLCEQITQLQPTLINTSTLEESIRNYATELAHIRGVPVDDVLREVQSFIAKELERA